MDSNMATVQGFLKAIAISFGGILKIPLTNFELCSFTRHCLKIYVLQWHKFMLREFIILKTERLYGYASNHIFMQDWSTPPCHRNTDADQTP